MHSNYRGAKEWRDLGVPLTTGSDEACKMYDAILSQMLSFSSDDNLGGMEGTFKRMKEADPDFVMGHVTANWMDMASNTRLMHGNDGLAEDIAKMKALAETTPGITAREKSHVHAIELWSQGYLGSAANVWEDIMVEHPQDISAIAMAFSTYLFMGKSVQLRDSIGRVLPHWKPSTPFYGYLMSRHAFGLEETNLYPQAEKKVREALALDPKDAWATHTLCHTLERLGRQQELIATMEATQANWEHGAHLACHNYWHWALNTIEMGDYETALSIFDDQLTQRLNASGSVFNLSDVTSLLYRLEFEGAPIGDRWHTVSDMYKKHLDDHMYFFYDIHIYMACLNKGDEGMADKMMDSIQDYIRNSKGDNRNVTAEVGENMMKAFAAYKDCDYAAAVDLMRPIRYNIWQVGGSHAQRDLFNLFLIQAAIRSPKKEHQKLARTLLNERQSVVAHAPMTERLMAKVIDTHDD